MNIDKKLLARVFGDEPILLIIGQSGCGKGTQSKIFKRLCKEISGKTLYISDTGDCFRKSIPKMSHYNRARIAKIQDAGRLQSWFTATVLWGHQFLFKYKNGPVLIDGSPRSIGEAGAIVDFFIGDLGKNIIVFHLKITDEEANERMIKRNKTLVLKGKKARSDTATDEGRREKIAFYHSDVMPAIKFLSQRKGVIIHSIDGMCMKEKVTEKMLKALIDFRKKQS